MIGDEEPVDVTVATGSTEVKIQFGIETREVNGGLIEYRKVIIVNDEPPSYGTWQPWTLASWVDVRPEKGEANNRG